MSEIVEKGPWKAGQEPSFVGCETYVESEDFTHDVRLIVDGDFEGHEQRFTYAEEIAKRLNAFEVVPAAERGEPLNALERSVAPDPAVVGRK